ncbi:MAG: polysaccharide pyruvyl transferase family protein [Cytophagales bacterium]|jgi:succinoglycan biosynthesis protein ExoV|nr:polysaccharide pyruvyl transferase family protein [Cytophagales bacterium]
MKLCYFDDNTNFGDALNATVFPALMPDFFDGNPDVSFFGIGSLFGLNVLENSPAKKKIIFSTGYGKYGAQPRLDGSHEIVCVRGPLTAEHLGLDKSVAVADGALLLHHFKFAAPAKQHAFSYMPHWQSEDRFDWAGLCAASGYHYISPLWNPDVVIDQILKSEVLLTEAMHGAIVADTLRTPWIPVKCYNNISEFKWRDWANSVKVDFDFVRMPALYNATGEAAKAVQSKTKGLLGRRAARLLATAYVKYHGSFKAASVERQFSGLRSSRPRLSKEGVVKSLADELMHRLEKVKTQYGAVLDDSGNGKGLP